MLVSCEELRGNSSKVAAATYDGAFQLFFCTMIWHLQNHNNNKYLWRELCGDVMKSFSWWWG